MTGVTNLDTMEPVASRLPAAFGATAALVVASISFLVQVSPMVCVTRAIAAFVVFAAFGIVIRYLLADEGGKSRDAAADGDTGAASGQDRTDSISPGTSVEALLAEEESKG